MAIDIPALFKARHIPVGEGVSASEALENIAGIIVGDTVIVIVLAAEPLLLAETVEGHFSLKVAKNIREILSK